MTRSSQPRGRFLSFEGMEGAGKSTNLAVVRRRIEAHLSRPEGSVGPRLVVTREPGGTPLAEEIRDLLLAVREEPVTAEAELLLIFAARAQHVSGLIEPALSAGDWVLSDRFTDASYAYQGGGRCLDEALIERLERAAVGALVPDLTLFLDLSWEESVERIRGRPLDRFEREAQDFFERVRTGYRERLAQDPERFAIIDAAQPLAAVEAQIIDVLNDRLQSWQNANDA